MATAHAKPADTIDIRPLGVELANSQTSTLIKSDALEVIRLVLPAGKEIKEHQVPGEVTVQCLEGKVAFRVDNTEHELTAGTLIYLGGAQKHALRAIDASSLLVTILLKSPA